MIPFRTLLRTVILAGSATALSACQPADSDIDAGLDADMQSATFSLNMVDDASFSQAAMQQAQSTGRTPPGTKYVPHKDDGGFIVKRATEITQDCLETTSAGTHPEGGYPILNFKFDETCTKIFASMTSENVGKQFAVILNGEIITAPRINSAITGGSGFIEGNFTADEAETLAKQLNRAGKRT